MTQSLVTTADLFMVTVDYARSLADMVKAGNYSYVSEGITPQNFPIKGEGKVDVEILAVYFGKDMASSDVLSQFDGVGLRAATLPELLAFGETYPEAGYGPTALGSVANIRGHRYAPSLVERSDGGVELGLYSFEGVWRDRCRFAAVRK